MSSGDFMPLEGWDHVELWVGNAKQAAYFYEHGLGFTTTAYAGPETGVRDRASYVLEQGDIRFVVTSGLQTSGVVIHRLPLAGRVALAHALRPAFLLAAFLCAAVFVISLLWVREAPLRTGLEDVTVADEASAQPGTRAAAR